MTRSDPTAERLGATVVAIAPLMLLAAFVLHPHIGTGFPDQDLVGEAAAEHTTRWGLAHVAAGVASGVVALAFLAIRARLRGTPGDRWSAGGTPLVVMGSTLYAFLPGMEFAPLAAAQTGGDAAAAGEELVAWFVPIHAVGALAFAAGVLAFASGISKSGLLGRDQARLIVGGLVVFAIARLVPIVAIQFYVQAAASLVALWPLAFELCKATSARSA